MNYIPIYLFILNVLFSKNILNILHRYHGNKQRKIFKKYKNLNVDLKNVFK